MRDDFESIRAERDSLSHRSSTTIPPRYTGLWKQIALGIVVGHLALGVLGVIGWWAFARLALSGLQIATP